MAESRFCKQDGSLRNTPFCPDCGSETIAACPNCSAPIGSRSELSSDGADFCGQCGKPMPWHKQLTLSTPWRMPISL